MRQYCPRDISLHKIREKPLVKAAHRLNRRPRKWLAASVLLKLVTWPSALHWQAECTICHGHRIIGGPPFLPPFPRCLCNEKVSRFFYSARRRTQIWCATRSPKAAAVKT